MKDPNSLLKTLLELEERNESLVSGNEESKQPEQDADLESLMFDQVGGPVSRVFTAIVMRKSEASQKEIALIEQELIRSRIYGAFIIESEDLDSNNIATNTSEGVAATAKTSLERYKEFSSKILEYKRQSQQRLQCS